MRMKSNSIPATKHVNEATEQRVGIISNYLSDAVEQQAPAPTHGGTAPGACSLTSWSAGRPRRTVGPMLPLPQQKAATVDTEAQHAFAWQPCPYPDLQATVRGHGCDYFCLERGHTRITYQSGRASSYQGKWVGPGECCPCTTAVCSGTVSPLPSPETGRCKRWAIAAWGHSVQGAYWSACGCSASSAGR